MSRDDLVRLVMSWRNTRAKMTRAQQAASPLPAVDDAWCDDLARCAWVLVRAYRGAHHVPRVRVGQRHLEINHLEINHCGDLSTADGDLLTRLVVLAHDAAVRVEVTASGPYRVKVMLHARRRTNCNMTNHSTLEEAAARVRGGDDPCPVAVPGEEVEP